MEWPLTEMRTASCSLEEKRKNRSSVLDVLWWVFSWTSHSRCWVRSWIWLWSSQKRWNGDINLGISIIEIIFKSMRPGEHAEGLRADSDEKRTKDYTWDSLALKCFPAMAHDTHVQGDWGIVWCNGGDQYPAIMVAGPRLWFWLSSLPAFSCFSPVTFPAFPTGIPLINFIYA